MASLQKELQGARIFITGGTGFIGTWLLESLARANDKLGFGMQALVLTRNVEAFAGKAPHLGHRKDIRFQVGDVKNFKFSNRKFSHVIHAATEASAKANNEQPLEMLNTVVEGTKRVLDFSLQCGAKQFLLTSTGAVLGRQPVDLTRMPEDYPGGPNISDPTSVTYEGKRLCELLCAIYSRQRGFEVKIARIFALVGPYLQLNLHYAMGNFIRDAMAGQPIKINGDGTPYRSYLYAADLTIWLWTILVRGANNRPYNVGSRTPLSIAEVAQTVSRVLPGRVPVEISQKPVPGQSASRYIPETARAQDELGLREWTSLEDGIRRTAKWYTQV
jgi:dTDP-glucose 4,6-dehydratase